jgi:hypothetical protein
MSLNKSQKDNSLKYKTANDFKKPDESVILINIIIKINKLI